MFGERGKVVVSEEDNQFVLKIEKKKKNRKRKRKAKKKVSNMKGTCFSFRGVISFVSFRFAPFISLSFPFVWLFIPHSKRRTAVTSHILSTDCK